MIAKHFPHHSAELYALFNIFKMVLMSLIMMMGGYMTFNIVNFRIFFLICGIANVSGQLLLLLYFDFEGKET
jgi:hypothetical protein